MANYTNIMWKATGIQSIVWFKTRSTWVELLHSVTSFKASLTELSGHQGGKHRVVYHARVLRLWKLFKNNRCGHSTVHARSFCIQCMWSPNLQPLFSTNCLLQSNCINVSINVYEHCYIFRGTFICQMYHYLNEVILSDLFIYLFRKIVFQVVLSRKWIIKLSAHVLYLNNWVHKGIPSFESEKNRAGLLTIGTFAGCKSIGLPCVRND